MTPSIRARIYVVKRILNYFLANANRIGESAILMSTEHTSEKARASQQSHNDQIKKCGIRGCPACEDVALDFITEGDADGSFSYRFTLHGSEYSDRDFTSRDAALSEAKSVYRTESAK